MTVNELATLVHPVIDRLTEENDHQAAILMKELLERLKAAQEPVGCITVNGPVDEEMVAKIARDYAASAGRQAYQAGFKR